jgi:hypothetical protein
MKTLQDCKNEVARRNEYDDWFQINMTDREPWEREEIKASMLDDVAKLYAESIATEALRIASEKASVQYTSGHSLNTGAEFEVNKQSIASVDIKALLK